MLAGLTAPDDAAVWKIDENRALVITTDFFTPIVDDPYEYGSIAAANSISDIYAMGGKPFLALNIAAMPSQLPMNVISEILRGGAEKAKEAGVVIAGGHTIQDKEPKYGLIVVGWVDPQKMFTKGGARPGDRLILSKPIGQGVVTSAIKNNQASPEQIREAVYWMKRLNQQAAEMGQANGVVAATDITGFSLLGHSWEMAQASNVQFRFHYSQIPFIQGAKEFAKDWVFPGGCFDNSAFYESHVHFETGLEQEDQLLLFDPETSGGLLMSVPPQTLDSLLKQAETSEQSFWVIGEVVEGQGIEIL